MKKWYRAALCSALAVLQAWVSPLLADDGIRPMKEHVQSGGSMRITVLSSRNDLVTGGDALIRLDRLKGGERVRLNGADVTGAFAATAKDARQGLVSGLRLGDNSLEVRRGHQTSRLIITNWPRQGPVFSGPHERPFVCMTEGFQLPVTGGTLGAAANENCEVRTRVDYVYRTTAGTFLPLFDPAARPVDLAMATVNGKKVPFVVQVETGVVNRAIYQTSRLVGAGWNGGLVFQFGGGCPGGMYIQGKTTGGVLEEEILGRGLAMASSSLNVFGNNCNDLLAAETMMMVKERFVESIGVPRFTIGWGCSGGSYQAEQIADNYPGLLDGIVVGCSFPDVGHAAVSVHSFGARLIYRYFTGSRAVDWTEAQIVAASGLPDFTSLKAQGARNDRINPVGVCNDAIPKAILYDPQNNREGARCSIYDHMGNAFGRDPATGFARRPLDNVGVQYGLAALRKGDISKAQFLDLNERIGGIDIDANYTPERTRGDLEAISRGYRSGRFLSTGAGLASIPVIDYRAYSDFTNGDPHQRFHSFSLQERMERANGNADNMVMLTEGGRYGLFSLTSPQLRRALDEITRWIANVQSDRTRRPLRDKVIAGKPAALVDACFREDGTAIVERQRYTGDTTCNRLYPSHANPYIVAGMPVSNNVLKCQLKPVSASDYPTDFDPQDVDRLRRIFPEGVCDYSRPGVEQQPLAGVWLSFGPAGAR